MQLYLVRIVSLVVIALVYMLFDLFNKRNVPSIFAYATLVYGVVLTLLYLDARSIMLSAAYGFVMFGVGYILYKIGQLGLADVIEFVALSLILPIQAAPILLPAVAQLSFPFILSLIVNTGIAAIIIAPLFYIPMARKRLGKSITSLITKRDLVKSLVLALVYTIFLVMIVLYIPISDIGIIIFVLILVSSAVLILFATPMASSIVQYIPVSKFEEGDMIDLNLMGAERVRQMAKKEIKDFGGLVTNKLIAEMKKKHVTEKFPVYKQGIPFALFIFIGLIISLLLGNVLLLIFVIH